MSKVNGSPVHDTQSRTIPYLPLPSESLHLLHTRETVVWVGPDGTYSLVSSCETGSGTTDARQLNDLADVTSFPQLPAGEFDPRCHVEVIPREDEELDRLLTPYSEIDDELSLEDIENDALCEESGPSPTHIDGTLSQHPSELLYSSPFPTMRPMGPPLVIWPADCYQVPCHQCHVEQVAMEKEARRGVMCTDYVISGFHSLVEVLHPLDVFPRDELVCDFLPPYIPDEPLSLNDIESDALRGDPALDTAVEDLAQHTHDSVTSNVSRTIADIRAATSVSHNVASSMSRKRKHYSEDEEDVKRRRTGHQ